MDNLPIDVFTQFQTKILTDKPAPKCHIIMYSRDTCYPRYSELDCHKCAQEWEDGKK